MEVTTSSYKETLAWLFATQRFGIKLGLDNIQRLLRELDLPLKEQRIIHVAGTNGKGSVCAMIDAIARAQGYQTGLFTSPHLVTFRERIQVNGTMISEPAVVEGLAMIRELVREWDPHPTFFEIVTALGLHHFREEACEIIVLETGMGGRLDATNAVTPVASVITPIDLDHQKWLGNTLTEIANEKAGIIKPGIPVVSALQIPEAERVVHARASERGAELDFVGELYHDSPINLRGSHQKQNAALAVAALKCGRIQVGPNAIREGLMRVTWPARFQLWNERIVIDGAHNPAGARVAVQSWHELFGNEKATLVFGVLRDKDIAEVVRELDEISRSIVLPRFRGERVVPPDELATIIASVASGMPCEIAESCSDAMRIAEAYPGRILVAGSLHLAGEVIALLQGTPAAFEECAQ